VLRHLVVDLQTAGPLGLFRVRRRARLALTTPLFVGPSPLPHHLRWPYLQTMRLGLSPTSTHGTDLFRGTREYARGDSRRSVHWPATARRGRLMVKELDGTGVISLRVVVELAAFGLAADEATGRAAWLAEEGLRRGWIVHLVTVEPVGAPLAPPLLVRADDLYPIYPPPPVTVRTVELTVQTPSQVRRRLAAAVPGPVELAGATAERPGGRWSGITRFISMRGDEWR